MMNMKRGRNSYLSCRPVQKTVTIIKWSHLITVQVELDGYFFGLSWSMISTTKVANATISVSASKTDMSIPFQG